MPIDPLSDELLTLPQAAKIIPPRRSGSKVSVSTLWRWYTRGFRGVCLEVVRVGGQVYTTRDAIRDFILKRSHTTSPPQQPLASNATVRSRRAMRALEKMGL